MTESLVTIQFSVVLGRLDWALVAVTHRGICSVMFGEDPGKLSGLLRERFPAAVLQKIHPKDSDLIQDALASLENGVSDRVLPLDMEGTEFQKRVWKALQNVPMGTVATYSDIAERIGAPRAVRAVANACRLNTVAYFVPCHRIVRKDGGISGYRWGVGRKKALQEWERNSV